MSLVYWGVEYQSRYAEIAYTAHAFLPCGTQGSNSHPQGWQQVPLLFPLGHLTDSVTPLFFFLASNKAMMLIGL